MPLSLLPLLRVLSCSRPRPAHIPRISAAAGPARVDFVRPSSAAVARPPRLPAPETRPSLTRTLAVSAMQCHLQYLGFDGASGMHVERYSLLRKYIERRAAGAQIPTSTLRILLSVAANHLVMDAGNLSAFSDCVNNNVDESEDTSAWRLLVVEHGSFMPLPPNQSPHYYPLTLLQHNKELLAKVDAAIAHRLAEDIREQSTALLPDDISALLSVCARISDTLQCNSLFRQLQDASSVTRESYWMMILAYSRVGNMKTALLWYYRLEMNPEVEAPGLRVFRTLITGLTRNRTRDLDLAMGWVLEYERLHFRPIAMDVYVLLMKSFMSDKRFDDVVRLFNRASIWWHADEMDIQLWNLCTEACGYGVNVSLNYHPAMQGKRGPELALEMFNSIPPNRRDVGSYYALMTAYMTCNDLLKAGKTCERALAAGFTISVRMWHVLCLSCLRQADYNSFDTYCKIALGTGNEGDQTLPLPLPALVQDEYFHLLLLQRTVQFSNDPQLALKTVRESLSFGVYPLRRTYEILMRCMIQHNKLDLALAIFDQMQKSEITCGYSAYHIALKAKILALGNSRHDTPAKFRQILDEIVFKQMAMNGLVPKTDTFNTILNATVSLGDVSLVSYLFQRFDIRPNIITYTILLKILTPLTVVNDLKFLITSTTVDSDTEKSVLRTASLDCRFFATMFSRILKNTQRTSVAGADPTTVFHQMVTVFIDLMDRKAIQPDAAVLNSLMAAYLRIGDPAKAYSVYESIMVAHHVAPTVHTLSALLLMFGSNWRGPGTAEKTPSIPMVTPRGMNSDSVQGRENQNTWIVNVPATAMSVYRHVTNECGVVPDAVVFKIFARELVRGSRMAQVDDTTSQMARKLLRDMDVFGVDMRDCEWVQARIREMAQT
ncbi:hypothetical protein HDU83_001651 [Entophlyctis luteolus]|nr:hypothetical protein HDU83_001651 [Entophlyctis luteolus]